jgi:hypothetical protein
VRVSMTLTLGLTHMNGLQIFGVEGLVLCHPCSVLEVGDMELNGYIFSIIRPSGQLYQPGRTLPSSVDFNPTTRRGNGVPGDPKASAAREDPVRLHSTTTSLLPDYDMVHMICGDLYRTPRSCEGSSGFLRILRKTSRARRIRPNRRYAKVQHFKLIYSN